MTEKTWLITGATAGFGRSLTEAVLADGGTVVGSARNPEPLTELAAANPGRLHPVRLDVTDLDAGRAVVADVIAQHGRIDVLVNNAGRTQVGALEETTDEELRALFDLHFFGPAALTRAVLPHMRRQGGGAVVQMSSMGGQMTGPGFGAYCATKFALEALTQSLSQEVDFGVRFLIVEPGAFRTSLFAPSSAYVSEPMPEYAATVGPTREYVRAGDGSQAGDPAKAARAIITALEADEPPLRLALGGDAVDAIKQQHAWLASDLEKWESVSRDTSL